MNINADRAKSGNRFAFVNLPKRLVNFLYPGVWGNNSSLPHRRKCVMGCQNREESYLPER